MHQENVRLVTFKNWSYHILDTNLLANNGFFANNNGLPICYFCNFHLTRWTDWTDEVATHRQNSPDCPIFSDNSANKPANVMRFSENIAPYAQQRRSLQIQLFEIHHSDVGSNERKEFRNISQRKASFQHAPPRFRRLSNKLVHAGFFFRKQTTTTYCFQCFLGVSKWNKRAEPLIIHTLASPSCSFIRESQPQKFITTIMENKANIIKYMLPADARSLSSNVIIMFENDILTRQLLLHSQKQTYTWIPGSQQSRIVSQIEGHSGTYQLQCNEEMSPDTSPSIAASRAAPHTSSNTIQMKEIIHNAIRKKFQQESSTSPPDVKLNSPPTNLDETYATPHDALVGPSSSMWSSNINTDKTTKHPATIMDNSSLRYPISEYDLFRIMYEINYHINHLEEIDNCETVALRAQEHFALLDEKTKSMYTNLSSINNQKFFFNPSLTTTVADSYHCFEKCYRTVHRNHNPDIQSIHQAWYNLGHQRRQKYDIIAWATTKHQAIYNTLHLLEMAGFYVMKPSYSTYFYNLTMDCNANQGFRLLEHVTNFITYKTDQIISNDNYHFEYYPLYEIVE